MTDLSPKIAAKLLATRRSLRGTEWDSAYLDNFVQVVCRLDSGRHGFTVDDLAGVEAAWGSRGDPHWSGGFVVRLKDGRRAHVDGYAGQANWSVDAEVCAEFLAASQAYPDLGSRQGRQPSDWDENTAKILNEFLGRLAA